MPKQVAPEAAPTAGIRAGGNIPVGQVGDTGITVNPGATVGWQDGKPTASFAPSVGVSHPVGDRTSVTGSLGVGQNSAGEYKPSVGVGVQHRVNDRVSVGAGVGTSGWNVGAQVHAADLGDEASLDVGLGYGSGGFGVTPTVTWQGSSGGRTGGQIGTAAGTAIGTAILPGIGTAIGALIGSAAGSGIGDVFSGNQKVQREGKQRRDLIGSLEEGGLLDKHRKLTMADGSTFDFSAEDQNEAGYRPYEIDYHKDTDFLAGMMGINLTRALSGMGDSKTVDQVGNGYGNAFLGKLGSGAELNPDNFKALVTNARAQYARSGIKSKEDMLAIANKMFADHRINDFDYVGMQQTANILFDSDFNTAQKLMAGRNEGIETAKKTPSNPHPDDPEREGQQPTPQRVNKGRSPILSPEEAMLSVKPYIDYLHEHRPGKKGGSSTANALATISAAASLYGTINKLTGGALNGLLSSGLKSLAQSLGITSVPSKTPSGTPYEDFDVTQGGYDQLQLPYDDSGFKFPSLIDFETQNSELGMNTDINDPNSFQLDDGGGFSTENLMEGYNDAYTVQPELPPVGNDFTLQ